ncbi:MAG: lipoyl synthase [Anaerolineae bacterium]
MEENIALKSRRPPWLKVRAPWGENYTRLKGLMRGLELHTVCEEALCPNIGECWGAGTATFLILGDTCTRSCGFCNIKTGRPGPLDLLEPERVARAVARMKLRHAVITSVNRDELPDGGAYIFAQTIRRIRERVPGCTVEVLIPDFKGSLAALATVMAERPHILNHNVETVPRLYRRVRPQANYRQSLEVLRRAKELDSEVVTKSGMMVGLGEEWGEIMQVMADLRVVNCDVLTIGQYLRPSAQHLPIERYYTPQEFDQLRAEGERLGFKHVESGPLVRSSYHAERHVRVRRP